jgi:uncharacterized repeat protein (TIGR01451 family)
MANHRKSLLLVILTAAFGLLTGCNELALEPAPGPLYGDRLPTQANAAKPNGSYLAPTGAAIRMEVLPVEATTIAQSPQILVATVHDPNGTPCRNCRVEWKLEGIGEIVAVDDNGTAPNKGRMIDGASGVTFTESAERRVSREGDANSAFIVKPGQSYCVITSPSVGDTRVTVHAGDSPSQSVVVRHWVEDNRAFPRTTATPGNGDVVLASYQGPPLFLTLRAPSAVAAGQNIACSMKVNNAGNAAVTGLTIRAAIPDGLQVAESKPTAMVDGKQLVWTLSELPARRSQTMEMTFKPTRTGSFTQHATLSTGEGAADDKSAVTEVVNGQLKLSVTGPANAKIDESATYEIAVRNLGSGPATHVLLSDTLDPGLEHATKSNPIELPLGTLAAGEKKTASLVLTPRRAGALVHRLTASADGNLMDKVDQTLGVQEGKLEVRVLGPTLRYAGRPAVWDVQVTNPGSAPVSNAVVTVMLPTELTLISAAEGGKVLGESKVGGALSWHLGTLGPREQRAVEVTTRCEKMTERTAIQAQVVADAGVRVTAETILAIRGLPTYRLQVVDLKDPIQVGDHTTYRIDVTNQGSLPGKQVEIIADVPPQLRIIDARGSVQSKIQGQRVTFPPIDALQPKQMLTYEVEVQALQPNDAHFRVELHSPDISNPIMVEESTTIYAPGTTPPSAPSPAYFSAQPDSFHPSSGAKPPPDSSTITDDPARPASDRTNWRLRK